MEQYKFSLIPYRHHALTFLLLIGINLTGFSQSIRKDYREMTVSERDALVAALNADGGPSGTSGIINTQATFHANNFDDIHFQDDFDDDVFFPWHRQNSLAVERVMQSMSDWVSLPYWDWTNAGDDEDNGPGGSGALSPLWTSAWLGGFDIPWSLGRTFNSAQVFPSAAAVTAALSETDFETFSQDTENGAIHTRGHTYTGGTMGSSNSPKDPTFYFHHNMVDKIWQDWEEIYGNSAYAMTTLPGFSGVNPNAIVDSRSIGVFYAENGLAELERYEVANLVLSNERFIYQFTIEAGNKFIVPTGKVCDFRSCNEIILKDGFTAQSGSRFHAKIDGDCDFSTSFKADPALAYVDTFDSPVLRPEEIKHNVYVRSQVEALISTNSLQLYPSPVTDQASIEVSLVHSANVSFSIVDALGRQIKRWDAKLEEGVSILELDAAELSSGIYYLTMQLGEQPITKKLIIQH